MMEEVVLPYLGTWKDWGKPQTLSDYDLTVSIKVIV